MRKTTPAGAAELIGGLRLPGAKLSVRLLEQSFERMAVVRGIVQPISCGFDAGAMVTAYLPSGIGYAASADLSADGLRHAADRALQWARATQAWGVFANVRIPQPDASGQRYDSPQQQPIPTRAALIELLRSEAAQLKCDPRIVHWTASLGHTRVRQRFFWEGELAAEQSYQYVEPNLEATAVEGAQSQTRSLAGQYNGFCQQGGFEVVERSGLIGGGARVAHDALQLLAAPNCPTRTMDLVLAPDQMMLQIHESIGHPLELDRILGDERNFAGTSFVTEDMFGSYRYGSELLNVSFDPGQAGELAAYAVDDEGTRARRERLIEAGILQRPLGGSLSQARARAGGFDLKGVANARANGWNRAPIDRMANINVEPGDTSFDDMIAGIERGVLMRTNVSWSIDDSRNKFQFGCEWGQLIENGRLTQVVRNPNYRGVSATFWRNLTAVGDRASFEVMGTPFCGKGEPGQVIRVGHAAPACRFSNVEVFGGAA